MQKSNMLIHESHIAEHGEISNTSPIASSRPLGLVYSLSGKNWLSNDNGFRLVGYISTFCYMTT